jgi:hypothetical protein
VPDPRSQTRQQSPTHRAPANPIHASFPSDFAPQSEPLKVAFKPEPFADAESCGAKSSALLERSSFKAIPYYSRSVQGWCSCSNM